MTTGSIAGNSCRTNHFWPSLANAQIAAVNFMTAPLAARNFKSAVGFGAASQRARNSCGEPLFSGCQTAYKCGVSELLAESNAADAAAFARSTAPFASTINAGHAALSKPNATKEFIHSNRE